MYLLNYKGSIDNPELSAYVKAQQETAIQSYEFIIEIVQNNTGLFKKEIS